MYFKYAQNCKSHFHFQCMTDYIGLYSICVTIWNKMLIVCVYSFSDKLYCVYIIYMHIHFAYMSANVKFKTNKAKLP